MRVPHALRVEEGPERYGELLAALAAAGVRFGWLEWDEPDPLPETLRRAAAAGALRAVAVGRELAVVVKPRKGPPVVRDLVREHFRGCSVVFVRGGAAKASLTLRGGPGGWSLAAADGTARSFDTAALTARLGRPRSLLGSREGG